MPSTYQKYRDVTKLGIFKNQLIKKLKKKKGLLLPESVEIVEHFATQLSKVKEKIGKTENQIAQTADVNNIMEFIDSEGNELHNYVLENGGTISPVSIHTPTTSSDSTATNTNFHIKRLWKFNINNEVALKLMEEARDQLVSMNTATTSTYDSFEIFGATVASELRLLKTPMLIRKAKKNFICDSKLSRGGRKQ
ncbi:hypothetical protein FQA39_LY14925 [Lamprigera yunnana]|nr:hypothetical protein FQA39_LY14925 [Lamprigera yunnana]